MAEDLTDRVRIRDEHVLSRKRYKLSEYDIDYRRNDGTWQHQNREIFDRKHAAAVLPIDPKRGTVILVKQFRLPAFLTGHKKMLVEVIAGALDNDAPDVCAKREAMEEAGIEVSDLKEVFNCFMSPGAITERIHLFVGTYNGRAGKGCGLQDEGEDIEILEMSLADAMAMINNGEIVDAKTIALLQWAQLQKLKK